MTHYGRLTGEQQASYHIFDILFMKIKHYNIYKYKFFNILAHFLH